MGHSLLDHAASVAVESLAVSTSTNRESLVDRLQDLDGLIESLFASWLGPLPLVPSRRSHRVPDRQFLALTPLDDESLQPDGGTQRVTAWDMSDGGLSFVHQQTLVCRTIAMTFQLAAGEFRSVLTRLKWCRFTRNGQYRSGGQFLRTIDVPTDARTDVALLPPG